MSTTRDRKIPLLIGGIVVAGGLLLSSLGVTAVIAGHAKMGVLDDVPARVAMRRDGDRATERGQRGVWHPFEGRTSERSGTESVHPGHRFGIVVPGTPGSGAERGATGSGNAPATPAPAPTDVPPAQG
ncbi:hypothetical protein [Xylanimonas protaetiae]|uniref:Uncharacterized protein n=1 Tax=Xylanimonas protaetiae TaxID=2509457 RepID=A0A4P6F6A8_9MICO|nr:hypothetical protein [Xylanimonas protaetiae]QAY71282.1 hypothetical protein ET471_15635 [Xylanimonas protaetiae]